MFSRPLSCLLTGTLAMVVVGCETTASFGDEALNRASFNRIQATPFTNRLDAKDCRASLDQAFGFPRASLDVKNGVKVSQAYTCEGKTIVAKVNLNNLNAHPMYCAAFTDDTETGAWIGPQGVAFFEYKFLDSRTYDCFEVR